MEKPKVNTINRILRKLSGRFGAKIMLKGGVLSVLIVLGILPYTLCAVDGVSSIAGSEIDSELWVNNLTDTILFEGASVLSDGDGLYEKVCAQETFYHISIKVKPTRNDTTYTPYDSLVCRLVPIKGKYPITQSIVFLFPRNRRNRKTENTNWWMCIITIPFGNTLLRFTAAR